MGRGGEVKRGRDGEEREGKEWVKRSRRGGGGVFFLLFSVSPTCD